MKGEEFHDQLSYHQLLKDCAPWGLVSHVVAEFHRNW
jgi:hypothetical protein